MTSYVVKKEQCPNCKKKGKDNARDNLAIYSDGHSFCYSCGFITYPEKTQAFKEKNKYVSTQESVQEPSLCLPTDSCTEYPTRALNWINQYELTENDLLLHNVLWSESISRLIFPIYTAEGNILAWQGRDFKDPPRDKKDKWDGLGKLRDTFNILGSGNKLVLTEDIISSIKVSKCGVMAMPLYGSSIGRERFKRLYSLYGNTIEVYVWLDPDKHKEAIKETKLGQLCGLNVHTTISDKDPKEHSYVEIKTLLDKSTL